jgi:hypothetical protein
VGSWQQAKIRGSRASSQILLGSENVSIVPSRNMTATTKISRQFKLLLRLQTEVLWPRASKVSHHLAQIQSKVPAAAKMAKTTIDRVAIAAIREDLNRSYPLSEMEMERALDMQNPT